LGLNLDALRQDDGRVLLFFFYVDQGNSWTAYEKCADPSTKPICATAAHPTPTN
jgi:hypothetical protein